MILVLTPGEPAGIGPDLTVLLAQQKLTAPVVAITDPAMLERRAQRLGLTLTLLPYQADSKPTPAPAGSLYVLPVPLQQEEQCGQLNASNAGYVLDSLRIAIKGCLQHHFDALVTGPVHKGIINQGGLPFTGHTEFLAELCDAFPVMMLATKGLRVALVTTHLPLSEVSHQITPDRLERVIRILNSALQHQFGIAQPYILVCGLNPHAGEEGHLGREEIEIIEPLLKKLRLQGMQLTGPLAADTLFTPKYLRRADAVLAMYHDQGLPVLKHLGFGNAVNITLGLPIIRTSVDHGTALELAGTGQVQIGSLQAAINQALKMASNRLDAKILN